MTPTGSPRQLSRRRTIFVNQRFQLGVALCFVIVVLAGAVLFAWFFNLSARRLLLAASSRGHYHFLTSYGIIGGSMARHLALLFVGVMAASLLFFLLLVRWIRRGAERLLETFRLSMEGDLSTPTESSGPKDFETLGTKLDAIRFRTIERINDIRAEAEFLSKEPLSAEEFNRRWDALKQAMGRVAP
jgi:methyl-accepting chemotaxis protein